jgi:hypothetical protein
MLINTLLKIVALVTAPIAQILLHNRVSMRQGNNAKHSLKCDEYSMKQNPNLKKKSSLCFA